MNHMLGREKEGEGPFDAHGQFDALAWIARACIRGVRPMVIYQPDGRRTLSTSFVNDAGGCVDWTGLSRLIDDDERREVGAHLEAMGRVIGKPETANVA